MTLAPPRNDAQLLEINRRFYDSLWSGAWLVEPHRFNTWPLVLSLVTESRTCLEIAPGLRPRLPIPGTHFVDISAPAVAHLRQRGGMACVGNIMALPFPDASFDLVCALDIVEHVDDEDQAFAELGRVCASGAALLLAVPLHPSRWTAFDDFVGHRRRYEPGRIVDKLSQSGFTIEQSAAYGAQPRSSRVLDWGIWWLTHQPQRAMWWYNRVLMPLGMRFKKKLNLVRGMLEEPERVDEMLIVGRKG